MQFKEVKLSILLLALTASCRTTNSDETNLQSKRAILDDKSQATDSIEPSCSPKLNFHCISKSNSVEFKINVRDRFKTVLVERIENGKTTKHPQLTCKKEEELEGAPGADITASGSEHSVDVLECEYNLDPPTIFSDYRNLKVNFGCLKNANAVSDPSFSKLSVRLYSNLIDIKKDERVTDFKCAKTE